MPYNDYRTALVTGASTGMGEAITRCLLPMTSPSTPWRETRAACRSWPPSWGSSRTHSICATSTPSLSSCRAWRSTFWSTAPVSRPGNVLDSSADDLDALVDVNLRAILQLARILVPGNLVERDLGHVINISSIAGIYNFYGHTAYHATKAARHQLSRQLRNDTVGRRIRVTEICPGRVETEIFGRNMGGTPEALQEAWETYYEGYESLTTADIVSAVDSAIAAPRHMNVSMMEILPTFQVPGGLVFDRREEPAGE